MNSKQQITETQREMTPEETGFDRVVEAALSRRGFVGGALVFGSAAALGAGALAGVSSAQAEARRFAFSSVPIATDSSVHVPPGYRWQVVAKWGQPLFSDTPDLDSSTGGSADTAARSFGENVDGMELFDIAGRQIVAINNEYTNNEVQLPQNADGVPASLEDVRKLQNSGGVSIMELQREAEGGWSIRLDSPWNRRITHNTPMSLAGPVAGHELVRTDADPDGVMVLGTLNNCGAGRTPWGTYLTCEENFNGLFGSSDENYRLSDEMRRYGVGLQSWWGYELFDERFDVAKHPNEVNRHGWIVEIDPADPDSIPIKHTALGRFKHENAALVLASDGRVVVYMGDDERGEFLYRYVSNGVYAPGADGSALLDDGKLYVAKFHDDQSGEWLELTPQDSGMESMEEVLLFARVAASRLGATTMDRPEWVAVNPLAAEAYCALTNNKNRGIKANAGGDFQTVGGPNPRAENRYGQIVRWYPNGGDHAARDFRWDLFVMAGNPVAHSDARAGSVNVHGGNLFNSPDGIKFDTAGLLWIQTDGNDSNSGDFAGNGNNQMLAGDPRSGRIERFLTGPKGCEITGLTWSSDRSTMFLGIQHPDAPFPDGAGKLPRSSLIAVWREDGAPMG